MAKAASRARLGRRKSLGVERNARLADELRQRQAQAAQAARERKAAAHAREKRLVDRQRRRSLLLAQSALGLKRKISPSGHNGNEEEGEKEWGECKATTRAQGKQPADRPRHRGTQREECGRQKGAVQSDLTRREGKRKNGKKRKTGAVTALDSAYEVEEGDETKTSPTSPKGRRKRIRTSMVDPDYSGQRGEPVDVSARFAVPTPSTRSKISLGVVSKERVLEQPGSNDSRIPVPAASSHCKHVTKPSTPTKRARATSREEATVPNKKKKSEELDASTSTITTTTTTTTPKSRHKTPKPPPTQKKKDEVENQGAPEPTSLEKEIVLLEQRAAREWLEEQQKREGCRGIRGLGAFDRGTTYRLKELYAEREAKRAVERGKNKRSH